MGQLFRNTYGRTGGKIIMIYSDEYVRRMKNELKEINPRTVVDWCKKQLKKSYNESKLYQLEIARDDILKEISGQKY